MLQPLALTNSCIWCWLSSLKMLLFIYLLLSMFCTTNTIPILSSIHYRLSLCHTIKITFTRGRTTTWHLQSRVMPDIQCEWLNWKLIRTVFFPPRSTSLGKKKSTPKTLRIIWKEASFQALISIQPVDRKEKVHSATDISSQKSQCCSFQCYLCYTVNGFALHARTLQHEK